MSEETYLIKKINDSITDMSSVELYDILKSIEALQHNHVSLPCGQTVCNFKVRAGFNVFCTKRHECEQPKHCLHYQAMNKEYNERI